MKKWLFSIFCYLMAVLIPICTIIAINLFEEELVFLTLVVFGSVTPSLMFIAIGIAANQPRRENKNE